VSGGKVDAYIGNLPVAQYHIAQRGISNLKVAASTSIGVHTQAFAVRKDWAPLASILDKGLAAIPTETRNSINRKYFSLAVTAQVDYTLLLQLTGVALLIIGIILYWNRRLAKEITLRKQTEQQLQETSERLRSILVSMDDLLFVLDAEGRFAESYQDDLERMMMSPAAFIGKHYREILPEPLGTQLDEAIAHAKGRDAQHFEYPLEVRTGWRWFNASLSARYQSNGEFAGNTVVVRDITERRLAEQQLKENQELLELVFNLNPDSSIITRLTDGIVIKVNEGFTTMSGFAREEVVGKQTVDIDLWENPEDRQHVIDELRSKGICENYEAVFKRKDGSRLVGIMSARRFSSQGIPHVIIVTRNITERKLAEQAVRDSQMRYQSLVDDIGPNFIVYSHRADGILEYVSKGIENIFGIPPTQAIGQHFGKIIDWLPESLEKSLATVKQMLTTGEGVTQFELHFNRTDGTIGTVLVTSHPVKDEDGNYNRIEGLVEDITVRKQAEEQRRESEQKLRSLYELSPLGIALTDMQGHYLEFNEAFVRIAGYPAEELKTIDYWTLTPPEYYDQEVAQLESLRRTSHYGPYEKEYRQKSGNRIPLRLNGLLITDRSGQPLIWSLIEDITLQKQQQDELHRAREAAEVANRAKSAFIANMSHELRTPLNAVLGFAQILQQDPSLGDHQRDHVQRIQRGGEYLLTLINDILDLAKIEAGRFELFAEVWDTRGVFQELSYMFRIRTEPKNIVFQHEQVTPLPHTLYSDDKRLRQVLINLLGNAVKFTEHGGVTLRTGYEMGKLWLEVVDSGVGIASVDLEKIFEPFQQTGTERYKVQGTGLGLAITYRLVQAMGGTLRVDSTLGQGSVFRVEIPAEVVSTTIEAHSPVEQPAVLGYRRLGDGGPLRVLEVDDLADNRMVVRYLLEPLGFQVEEAENGQRCLDLVPNYQPDVIFMDLRMPQMDGLQVTRALRAQGFQMPIIALSASTFAEDRTASFEAGCAAHLAKPVRLSELLETLAQWLPLEWEYAASPPLIEEESVLETLSAEQVAEFLRLTEIGDVIGLEEFAGRLETCSPQFAKQLGGLVKAFQLDKIDELAKAYQGGVINTEA
jgi:PAS domain S-box-containing protein